MTSHQARALLIACAVGCMASITACGDEEERPEVLTKLRAIGVQSSQVILAPSTADAPRVAELTFIAALPKGSAATAEPFHDDGSKYARPIDVTLIPNSETLDTSSAAIDLFTVKAQLTVPPTEALKFPATGFLALRYGLKILSGAESEVIVGNILVYPEGAPQLSWQPLSVTIDAPVAGATFASAAKTEIKALITKSTEENVRVGWYATGGKIKNRRSKTTEWEAAAAGPQALIVTVRGLKSGSFAYKIADVTVQ